MHFHINLIKFGLTVGQLNMYNITKTCLYNIDPLKPHFYLVKLGFAGVYIIFLIFAQHIDCGYTLEPSRRGSSNGYTQSMFWADIWKKYQSFISKIFQFLEVKFSIYLNKLVFVMKISTPISKAPQFWTLGCTPQFWLAFLSVYSPHIHKMQSQQI